MHPKKVRLENPDPAERYSLTIPDTVLPSIFIRTVIFCAGVKEYQTVVEFTGVQAPGSPGSRVAFVLSTVALKGKEVMTSALIKLSFAGGKICCRLSCRIPACPLPTT